jgi:hypothetical protein
MALRWFRNRLVNWDEAVVWMDTRSIGKAFRAKVPIRTGQALVTNAINALETLAVIHGTRGYGTHLFAPVADSSM